MAGYPAHLPLDGRVAVVTGASRGIGLGIAQRLVDEGAKVAITARGQEALDAAVEALGGPEHALAVAGKADVTASAPPPRSAPARSGSHWSRAAATDGSSVPRSCSAPACCCCTWLPRSTMRPVIRSRAAG